MLHMHVPDTIKANHSLQIGEMLNKKAEIYEAIGIELQ